MRWFGPANLPRATPPLVAFNSTLVSVNGAYGAGKFRAGHLGTRFLRSLVSRRGYAEKTTIGTYTW